ncbi:MAG: 50S ribosome-binding GTPase [Candidatus Omnitrophica bacterium]|nr:50S ribosome-binding GTPase [Candidatus Omnitrophota bacterium]MCM8777230.1 50S ribosome-binding GTPase [Candidatus Omnitrophota bacterium]
MPVNLPPQYHQKEAELKTAKTLEEKISILEELLAIMPKHKSSEKLQALLRTKIAKYRKELEKKPQTAKKQTIPVIVKEGAGQVVLCGPPNSGKSTLLSVLTKARPEIADYPFTTKIPTPGMMKYKDINIQLVDTPSLSYQFSENWLGDILRKADALIFLFDLASDSLIEDMDDSLKTLERFRIKEEGSFVFTKKILWAGNKIDNPSSEDIKEIFKELYGDKIQNNFIEISAKEGTNLEILPEMIFKLLDIIRVYTKIPGKPPDTENPYTLKKDSLVIDLAEIIHKDIAKNFKYARLWREGDEKIAIAGRDYKLEDGDIVEVHI